MMSLRYGLRPLGLVCAVLITGWMTPNLQAQGRTLGNAPIPAPTPATPTNPASTSIAVSSGTSSPIAPTSTTAQLSAGCQPDWLPTFGSLPGIDQGVSALAVYDDGTGPALYAGGSFEEAGGHPASCIAKWDGTTWSPLGSGLTHSSVYPNVRALAVFDDGSGPALYATGSFDNAGGVTATGIARWNGTSWSAVGPLSPGYSGAYVMTVYDDGTGPALYLDRQRWNGTTWQSLGGAFNGPLYALKAFDDGSGMALYAGGAFTTNNGSPMLYVSKWNGTAWVSAGSGIPNSVLSFEVFDDGSGPALHCGGFFADARRLSGGNWTALSGSGLGSIASLEVFDDGSGAALYAGSGTTSPTSSTSGVRKWNGTAWSTPGVDVHGVVAALVPFDDGSGPALFAGGGFLRVGTDSAGVVAKWNGTTWSATGTGHSLDGPIRALTTMTDATGTALYAGIYSRRLGVTESQVSRWDGFGWTQLGGKVNGTVFALEVADFGNGSELYVGGSFTQIGAQPVNRVARWTGTTWAPLAGGITDPSSPFTAPYVIDLQTFDDGTGPALYATGCFPRAGTVSASNIAKWNGTTWQPVGGGLNDCGLSLTTFDDGGGTRLYAGGVFSVAGASAVHSIAKWTGSTWSPLAGGVGTINGYHRVETMTTFDDGSGTALFVGGFFPTANGVTVNSIAKWNGSAWSALGTGLSRSAYALMPFDDGSGPSLFVGGEFVSAGGVPARRLARWDPVGGWSAPSNGFSQEVRAMAVFDDRAGDGPALFVGGLFGAQYDSGDSFLAKWQPCPGAAIESFCSGDGSGTACPCGNAGSLGQGCANSSFVGGARLGASGIAHVVGDSLVLTASQMPNGPALYFQGTTRVNAGAGVSFGDGLRCAGGSVIRLGVAFNASNQSRYPPVAGPSVSTVGACAPGDVRTYQTWYRDSASFCTSSTFNLTNGLSVTWGP